MNVAVSRAEIRDLRVSCLAHSVGLAPPPDSEKVLRALEALGDDDGAVFYDTSRELEKAKDDLKEVREQIAKAEAKLASLDLAKEQSEALARWAQNKLNDLMVAQRRLVDVRG